MRKIKQYKFYRLLLFACFIGFLIGSVIASINIFLSIDLIGFGNPLINWLISTLIFAFVFTFILIILQNKRKDKFLIKR